jgi:alcohol dehydrogenase class IV
VKAEILMPSIMKIGGGSFADVATLLVRLRCKRPLIITDPFLMKGQLPGRLREQMRDAGLSSEIFHETVADPTTTVVEAGVRVFVEGDHDSLVSLGGGSPIDTAKAIGMLAANGGGVRDYKVPNPIPVAGPTHVAVPTTAGTGSEVTRFTVITDVESGEKMLIGGGVLVPTAAVVDYELSLTMPRRLTADTGTDSLTHAIEAYVSRKANPFTDAFALTAMKTIWRELPASFRDPENLYAREAMMLAATQAGIAFSNASVALVHGMSRPLGAHFHVPHGLSNAMLLPAVTKFSAEAAMGRYAECARTMGIARDDDRDEKAVDELIRALYARNAELEVPSPMQFGIDEERYFVSIPTMAAQALASGSPQNNPRIPTAQEIETIYREVWQE